MKKIVIIAVLIVVIGIGAWILFGRGTPSPVGTIGGIPTSDVIGEDISDVPRYPGSVRIHYGTVPGVTDVVIVVYLTSANIDTVSDFYEKQLPANGWVSPMDEETMQMFGLTYKYVEQAVKKGEREIIVMVSPSADYSGYTEVNISFPK
jgi:hypothetical protein